MGRPRDHLSSVGGIVALGIDAITLKLDAADAKAIRGTIAEIAR